MIEAIFKAHEVKPESDQIFDTIVAECGKPKHEYQSFAVPEELFDAIQRNRSSRSNGRSCIYR